MEFLFKEKQRDEINRHLALFCSFDREKESLFSLFCEERKREIDSLTSSTTLCHENYSTESIFVDIYKLIHPENLGGMLLEESPMVKKIILLALPAALSEMVQFYLPPEIISEIKAMPVSFNLGCPDVILATFGNQIVQALNKCLEDVSESNQDKVLLKKLLSLSYEEIFSLLKSAGEIALNNSNTNPHKRPGRNEVVFAGYALLAALLAGEKDEVKKMVLNKFSLDVQRILHSILSEKNEEIKWMKQKSEKIFKTVLKIS